MEHKIAAHICDYMTRNGIIRDDFLEVYVYGTELLLSFLTSVLLVLGTGALLGRIAHTIAFLVVFILVRRFTGGYHAHTYVICKLFTVGTYLTVMLLSHVAEVTMPYYLLMTLPGLLVVAIWGPIENPNKPLSETARKKHKLTGLVLYTLTVLVGIYLHTLSQPFGNVICYTLASIIVLMILAILKKGIANDEKDSCKTGS